MKVKQIKEELSLELHKELGHLVSILKAYVLLKNHQIIITNQGSNKEAKMKM
jgi:hypothetical protein